MHRRQKDGRRDREEDEGRARRRRRRSGKRRKRRRGRSILRPENPPRALLDPPGHPEYAPNDTV